MKRIIAAITLIILLTSLLTSCHPIDLDNLMHFLKPRGASNYECGTCCDNGFLTCNICSGTAKITCKDCEGSGSIVCVECEGSGLEKCNRCNGHGSLSPIFNPSHSSNLPSVCTTCWGSGESKTCPTVIDCECNDGIWYCASCNFTGKVDCPDC